jgi:stage II sporulation protein D
MAHWLPDKLLAVRPFDGTVRRSRCYWLWAGSVGFAGMVLLAVLFHGCEQREVVRPTPQMDTDPQFLVRVLLASNATSGDLATTSPVRVVQSGFGPAVHTAGTLLGPMEQPARLMLSGGRLLLGQTVLPGSDVILSPESPYIFNFNGDDYRGKLQLIVDTEGQGFEVINLVPLEPYLAGVVGEEMPDYWELEALKAQAIAARTYCLYTKNRFGAARHWDVSRTQANQVYGGVKAESSQVWNAVNSTAGQVVAIAEQSSGSRRRPDVLSSALFPAYYSSICGGHTADSQDVFGEPFLPLKGVDCPYCKDVAKLGLFYWPMAHFDRATVTRQLVQRYPKLETLGEIQEIAVIEERDYGEFARFTKLRLVGATGRTDTVRGEDLRLAIDPTGRKIKSTVCTLVSWGDGWAFLSGRGWGHGVGLCQCGAEGLARSGRTADEILQYYYPGCTIVSVY